MQLDVKARAEIPRCTGGSGGSGVQGGAVAAGVVVVLGVVANLVMRVRNPCVNAFDFKFGSKISLCGPETVRKTHSALAVAVALAVVVVEIGIGVGVGVLVRG